MRVSRVGAGTAADWVESAASGCFAGLSARQAERENIRAVRIARNAVLRMSTK